MKSEHIKIAHKRAIKRIFKAFHKFHIFKKIYFQERKNGKLQINFGNNKSLYFNDFIKALLSKKSHNTPYFLKIKLHELKIKSPKTFHKYISTSTKSEMKYNFP